MASMPRDQAAGLRRLSQAQAPKPVRVIAVTSGKGGVGKTNVSVNLATAMAGEGKQVMLLDADLGLANVDVLLGLYPRYNLSHVIRGERSLDEVMVGGGDGLRIIPAASGLSSMAGLSPAEHAGLIRAFSEVGQQVDVLIVDTAAGICNSVVMFSKAAQEVVVVACDEPASITDAYALMKVLSRDHDIHHFHILANMVQSPEEGAELYRKIVRVTDRFLDVTLDFMGSVPHDIYLRKALQKQRSVVEAYPASKAALAFKKLAREADNWPVPAGPRGHLEFFVERLIQIREPYEPYEGVLF